VFEIFLNSNATVRVSSLSLERNAFAIYWRDLRLSLRFDDDRRSINR